MPLWSLATATATQRHLNGCPLHVLLQVLDKFREYSLPLNVLQMDCGWHVNNTPPTAGCAGYNGYDWNEHLFPDPKAFVAAVKDAGPAPPAIGSGWPIDRPLKLLLNTHNFLGLDHCQAEYPAAVQMLQAEGGGYLNMTDNIKYNTTDLKTMTVLFDLALGLNATGIKTAMTRPSYWWHDGGLNRWSNQVN
jgi:hypothetical protein